MARAPPGRRELLEFALEGRDVQSVGADLWAVAGEIDKLVLYAGDRPITDADVKALVGYVGEANIFNLVDSIFETRLKAATEALESLKIKGLSASYVLAMLSRQLRLVVQYKDMKSHGEKDVEIRRRLGLLADFVWKKTQDQAGGFTMGRLKDVYRRLLEADLAAKTGRPASNVKIRPRQGRETTKGLLGCNRPVAIECRPVNTRGVRQQDA